MSDFLIIGVNDTQQLGDGWYERSAHQPSGILYRPVKPVCDFTLSIKQPASGKSLFIMMTASPSLIGKSVEGDVLLNGKSIGAFKIETDFWNMFSFPIPDCAENSGALNFSIKTNTPFIPDMFLKNGDHREMGVYFALAVIK